MKILIVGSGGREHALAWKIAKSPRLEKLYCAPGNGGTATIAQNVPIKDSDIHGLVDFALKERIDLTVVGPELPLSLGIVDRFEEVELKVFGPNKKAAELEGSKIFAKQFMERHKIPTGRFRIAETVDKARKILNSGEFPFPLVVKADGLAGGKGAVICHTPKRAEETVTAMMVQKKFGDAGKRVLIEEFLRGKEVSFIVLSDGAKVQPLVTTMDHKAVYDGDRGLNTGGMGAISPSPFINSQLFSETMKTIVLPTVTRMLEEGRKFKGVLYVGLMLTDDGPKVLEYNCRFGDPETQPQMIRLESDLLEVLLSVLEENVLKSQIRWSARPSGCVVLTAGGYPQKYETGKVISGLKEASEMAGLTVFHAGTKLEEGQFLTSGGRVLGVCASEETLALTMQTIYKGINLIHFDAMHYRRDIGAQREEK